jgi:hypothetical protein
MELLVNGVALGSKFATMLMVVAIMLDFSIGSQIVEGVGSLGEGVEDGL